MINVTPQIIKFRDFLVHSWNDLDLLMANHDWDDDVWFTDEWLQVNWEFLVERQLLHDSGFLKSYFFCNVRVTHPNTDATCEIICKPKNNEYLVDDATGYNISSHVELCFGYFVNKMDKGYGIYPPFDFLTAYTEVVGVFWTET